MQSPINLGKLYNLTYFPVFQPLSCFLSIIYRLLGTRAHGQRPPKAAQELLQFQICHIRCAQHIAYRLFFVRSSHSCINYQKYDNRLVVELRARTRKLQFQHIPDKQKLQAQLANKSVITDAWTTVKSGVLMHVSN